MSKKKQVKPSCPKCKSPICWDWCQDCYVVKNVKTGKWHPSNDTECFPGKDDDVQESSTVLQCPLCGQVLGIHDPEGEVRNISEFGNVDWEEYALGPDDDTGKLGCKAHDEEN